MTIRQEEQDDGVDELTVNPDEFLPPVVKLQKYADSDIIFNRQVVARSVLDTLRTVVSNPEDVESIVAIVIKLSDDSEPSVRAELMEQVPLIANFCQEQNGLLKGLVNTHLVPIIIKYLTDINNQWNIFSQVRKAAQIALLLLLEQQLVDQGQLEKDICPLVIQLTEDENMDDHRTEAVSLMSKMARLVGKEVTEQIFLKRFATLCLDSSFHVRKVCATNFGEFCAVVGRDTTQGILLGKFYHLCDDSIWGVRKACADVFMPVSCICSMEIRQSDLAPLFVNLLCDQSRWVRTAAFQALGPFISTFADPNKTGLCYDEDGIRVLQGANMEGKGDWATQERELLEDKQPPILPTNQQEFTRNVPERMRRILSREPLTVSSGKNNLLHVHMDTTENAFDNFQYWRVPIPELELDIDMAPQGQATSISVRAKIHAGADDVYTSNLNVQFRPPDGEHQLGMDDQLDLVTAGMRGARLSGGPEHAIIQGSSLSSVTSSSFEGPQIFNSSFGEAHLTFVHGQLVEVKKGPGIEGTLSAGSLAMGGEHNPLVDHINSDSKKPTTNSMYLTFTHNQLTEVKKGPGIEGTHSATGSLAMGGEHNSTIDQDIVPSDLLEQYLSMTDALKAQVIDPEIVRFCAYSFPAVALTLGRKHWPCLRQTFRILASDMRWKVRRTLAASMHELAVILGSDLAAQELLPVFESFMRDLDEVRIGILHHLARFLKLLRPSERRSFLPQLTNFLKLDNENNWRFRLTLTEQLMQMVELYSPSDIKEYLIPIALLLVQDRVCEVRQVTLQVLAVMLRRIGQSPDPLLLKNLVADLVEQFIRAPKWSVRQTFAFLCEQLMLESSMSEEQFASDVLPHLLGLCWDSVANVRLAVARCITHTLFSIDYFLCSQSPDHSLLLEALQILQQDGDRDVRFYAHPPCLPPDL